MKPEEKVAVDMDATIIPTERGNDIQNNYKNGKSHMAFNCYVPDLDLIVHSEFPPETYRPATTSPVCFEERSPSSRILNGYHQVLLQWRESVRSHSLLHLGPTYKTYREETESLSEKAWRYFVDGEGRENPDRQWVEVNIVQRAGFGACAVWWYRFPRIEVSSDKPGHLLPGIPRRPFKVSQYESPVSLAQSVIAKAAEDIRNVLVPGVPVRLVSKSHSFRAGHELPDLFQSLQLFVIHVDHHAHVSMIDQNHPFRLIPYWKSNPSSDSYHVGKDFD
jgi:hypothetical protein